MNVVILLLCIGNRNTNFEVSTVVVPKIVFLSDTESNKLKFNSFNKINYAIQSKIFFFLFLSHKSGINVLPVPYKSIKHQKNVQTTNKRCGIIPRLTAP